MGDLLRAVLVRLVPDQQGLRDQLVAAVPVGRETSRTRQRRRRWGDDAAVCGRTEEKHDFCHMTFQPRSEKNNQKFRSEPEPSFLYSICPYFKLFSEKCRSTGPSFHFKPQVLLVWQLPCRKRFELLDHLETAKLNLVCAHFVSPLYEFWLVCDVFKGSRAPIPGSVSVGWGLQPSAAGQGMS